LSSRLSFFPGRSLYHPVFLFFAIRVFWGIVGPLILSFMVLQTAKIHSNTSATGILYVSLAFILMGELLSCYLLVSNTIPI